MSERNERQTRVVVTERADGKTEIHTVDLQSGREMRTGLAIDSRNTREVERHVREIKECFERAKDQTSVVTRKGK